MATTQKSKLAAQVVEASRTGDSPALRDAIARYVLEQEELIRSLARRKLTARARRIHDSEDVLASVLRRVDLFVARGHLKAASENDVMSLIVAIVRNTAVTKVRLAEQARRIVADDGPYVQSLLNRANACASDDDAALLVSRMMLALDDATQRQYLGLRLRGASHRAVAQVLGLSEAAARQRWGVIVRNLHELFSDRNTNNGD